MAKRDDFETPAGVNYEGPSGIARDSVWLTQEDIPHDKDTVLLVEAVRKRENVKFQGGRAKPVMLSLKFAKLDRELGLNATNRKVMNALYSTKCKEWVGKWVALHVVQDVDTPQGPRPAVRILAKRIERNAPAKTTAQAPVDNIDADFERAAAAASPPPADAPESDGGV